MNEPSTCISIEKSKHSDMQEAIDGMEFVVAKAASLLGRISGEGIAEYPMSVPQTEPSLSSVLNSGPSEIRDNCSKIHGYLDEIEGTLF